MKLDHRTPEDVRAWLGKLQWCIIIWYFYDDNSVSVTTCPSLKACFQEVYENIGTGYQDVKKELVKHFVTQDEDKSIEWNGNDTCTIQTLEDKDHFQCTARELCYETS